MDRGGENEGGGLLNTKLDRRAFVKKAAQLASAVGAVAIGEKLGFGVGSAEAAGPDREPQIDMPKGTYLTSMGEWLLSFKGISTTELERLNGPKRFWGLASMGGVLLAPAGKFGGKEGADSGAKERLAGKLIFRVDPESDKNTGAGFVGKELDLMQTVVPFAAQRCVEFFGKPWKTGLVKISKPSLERRERIRASSPEAATFGGCVIGSETNPGAEEILVFTDFEEYLRQNPSLSPESAFLTYATQISEFIPHEMGHVYLQQVKLGEHLDNHNIVRVAGISANIKDLIGKQPGDIAKEIAKKGGMHTDLVGPEMLLWKMFKVKGREFFAELIGALTKQYGNAEQEFSEGRVSVAANKLFREVGFNFTYEDLLNSLGKGPENGKVQIRQEEGYRYPVEKVAGDQANPDGVVSWWVEVKTLAPPTLMPAGWSMQSGDIFPDKDGYYSVYKFAGNGKLNDGPPQKNNAAVASWMKGGSLSSGEVMFPLGMVGTEIIRSSKVI